MGKLSRTKGHSFERLIAREFQQELGMKDARRHLEYHAREANGLDLANTYPFGVQCKRGRKYAAVTKIDEVMTNDNHPLPLLITQADRCQPIAVMYWKDLLKLLKLIEHYPLL